MQDRQGQAFVIATANDVSAIPPELLRKGRFDEIFFVDTPNSVERKEVLVTALNVHGRKGAKIDAAKVCSACEGFTGSEIAAIVPEAMFTAFADDGREIKTEDLIAAARNVVPLIKTAEGKINALREWAKQRARYATTPLVETPSVRRGGRQLDV